MLRFFDLLFPPRADERTVRELREDEFLALLDPRLVPSTRPAAVGLLRFGDPQVRAAIHEAKYHGSERAFALLAAALADYLRENDELGTRTVLVPVPLGRARRKERGYNQVEEVARRVARELNLALDSSLLERVRETPTQVSLSRDAREENMRGAFATTPWLRGTSSTDIANTTYIVVDDVITTGATLQAALDALTSSGASHIIPIALAR